MQFNADVTLVGSGQFGCQMTNRYDCNVYLVRCGEGKYALVDAGGGIEPERIVQAISRAGVEMSQISALLLTHIHGDHAAGAAFFHQHYQIPVIASEEAADWLEQGDLDKSSIRAAIRAGVYPESYSLPPCPVARRVKDGERLTIGQAQWRVLETPGHARGHVSYMLEHAEGTWLFSGDTVFAGGKVVIQYVWDCEIAAYADTVYKLDQLRIDALYPGHGTVVLQEAWRHIAQARACFDRLEVPPNL